MRKNIKSSLPVFLLAAALLFSGCGTGSGSSSVPETSTGTASEETVSGSISSASGDISGSSLTSSRESGEAEEDVTYASEISRASSDTAPEISGLTFDHQMQLDYAKCFDVYYYQDGFKLIDVPESAQYLIVPEGQNVPDGLSDDIVVLQQPLDHIYLAATSAMSLFDAIDALDSITLTGTNKNGWYIENAKKALESGAMQYAGKYSEPDYEMLVDSECDLAIESTMILHSPEVQEMLEDLDIPVFIDRSSYEPEALGRTEWIRLYAAMLNKEDAADSFFRKEVKSSGAEEGYEDTGKTVAYFSITSDGSAVIRGKYDYIASMIREGGGVYAFDDTKGADTNKASVTISMEEFYSTASDADYLIYNSTIEDSLKSVDELIEKDSLFADFKAVKDGNVYQAGKNMYQRTDTVAQFIGDVHQMLTGGSSDDMTFLSPVN